jgi:23S rRNA pseudouridine1911/1915/1917 synthase
MPKSEIQILYEDNDILAINKPAGLVVHSDGKTIEPSVADWIMEKYPHSKNVGEPINLSNGEKILRPGIVHRLDRETSGVLLLAKTSAGFTHLKNQFQNRQTEKIYNAFVYGIVKTDEGTIDRPINRSKKDFRLWSAQRGGRGEARDAITHYKVLKRGPRAAATYLEVRPETGRTHQIRVHFKAINHPVVGDNLYAPKKAPILSFARLALHASKISFLNLKGERVDIEAPLPRDFEVALSLFS